MFLVVVLHFYWLHEFSYEISCYKTASKVECIKTKIITIKRYKIYMYRAISNLLICNTSCCYCSVDSRRIFHLRFICVGKMVTDYPEGAFLPANQHKKRAANKKTSTFNFEPSIFIGIWANLFFQRSRHRFVCFSCACVCAEKRR